MGGSTQPQRGTQSKSFCQLWIQTPRHGLLSSALPWEAKNVAFHARTGLLQTPFNSMNMDTQPITGTPRTNTWACSALKQQWFWWAPRSSPWPLPSGAGCSQHASLNSHCHGASMLSPQHFLASQKYQQAVGEMCLVTSARNTWSQGTLYRSTHPMQTENSRTPPHPSCLSTFI